MVTLEQEFQDLKDQSRQLETTIQRLQADLYNAYREYQRLSEKAFRHAAESMREACTKQAVALAQSGVPPEKYEEILSQIPIYPGSREDVSDIQDD
jgi:translation initiation factor 2 alpha subunit (eIF-2alpha)